MNDKGKEIVTFLVDVSVSVPPEVDPERQGGVAAWRVEKYYSDVLALDSNVKSKTSRQESKSIGALPDKSLFKDHAPHKSDQRKMVLERYLQTLLALSLRDRTAICAFFNSDIVPDAAQPSSTGAMAGWLTKRGRNFGGWQTRYYVLTPGTALSYYDTQNGTKLGEIPLVNAAIGRQSSRAADAGEDAYLHAFLIRTLNEKEQDADHILCAENDEARDAWVQALTTLQPAKPTPPPAPTRANGGSVSFDRERIHTSGIPMPAPTPPPMFNEERRGSGQASSRRQSTSAAGSSSMPPQDPRNLSARLAGSDMAPSASMPANLDAIARGAVAEPEKRSTSAQGHHNEVRTPAKLQAASDRRRPSGQSERPASPERERERHRQDSATKLVASNVSGPMNAQPLPSGYEFKKAERQKKTKSSFWNFGARGANEKPQAQPAAPSRPVFGVPLKEAVNISRIRPGLELPAVVYRCVEYLEAKNAECEEGIFRLSGSANVIRLLKERFNAEGDVNLLTSNEYYDPHAIAGLLKQYLRELPVHLLTRELHAEFIQVIDLRNRRDRVNALGRLVAQLPIEEYTLFRFFFAHLCVIAQNADVSKMNVRNLGIVFSPTLAIPAPLFTLLLAEFDLVFAVEQETGLSQPILLEEEQEVVYRVRKNRNSELYSASGAALLMEGDATTRYSLRGAFSGLSFFLSLQS
ncbi:hypothetical protein BCR35DRAFT_134853 [Leucosporidium creatinivorum]|uniref:Rho GTPase activation protein n=1 Tax=Leucosporidium creatinivorum TaxID=106004 RepID=A0A1Y2G0P0_9BASI|nr:hypothetical protein BCR35DRAFT_134853 [Leucosporidium creatinivorum]